MADVDDMAATARGAPPRPTKAPDGADRRETMDKRTERIEAIEAAGEWAEAAAYRVACAYSDARAEESPFLALLHEIQAGFWEATAGYHNRYNAGGNLDDI